VFIQGGKLAGNNSESLDNPEGASTENSEEIIKYKLVEQLHSVFLESMENRYKEILSVLGFLIPAITGFIVLLQKYEVTVKTEELDLEHTALPAVDPILTFFIGSIAIIFILSWGAAYALAISYRYRYLQASVYKIEEAFGADNYIPNSFKPKIITGIKDKLVIEVAPGIMQVHVFFFMIGILGVCLNYILITSWSWHSITIIIISIVSIVMMYIIGSLIYAKKLNKIIRNLDNK
jgi:hypothetical protein